MVLQQVFAVDAGGQKDPRLACTIQRRRDDKFLRAQRIPLVQDRAATVTQEITRRMLTATTDPIRIGIRQHHPQQG